jgi:uncharacterized protein
VPWEQYRRRHQAGGSTLSAAEIDHALLLLGSLRRSPLEVRADEPLRRARVVVYLHGASYARIDRLLASLEPWRPVFAGLVPFGDAWISHQTVELLVVGQVRSVTLALVADFLLLLLIFRSWRSALVAVVPTAVAIVGVFGFLATTGIPLSIASSMFAAIALGIGVDYAIHLVVHVDRHRDRGEPLEVALRRGFAETAPAITKSAVAVSAGLALLMLSGIRPNAELGLLVCLSQVLCATATLVLVPALLLAFRPPSRITRSRRHEKTKRYA